MKEDNTFKPTFINKTILLLIFALLAPINAFAAAEKKTTKQLTTEIEKKEEIAETNKKIDKILEEVKIQPIRKQGKIILDKARFAAKYKDIPLAKKLYHEALNYELTHKDKKDLLLEFAQIYDYTGEKSKIVMIYEKFLEEFPKDHSRSTVLLRLGRLYREMGSYEMAIARFYSIIDMSLAISKDQLVKYKKISHDAQLEIADTYFLSEDYEKASKLFQRLELTDLHPLEKERIFFKRAYAAFYLKKYESCIKDLNTLISDFPNSSLIPEARFTLVSAYKKLDKAKEAIDEVMILLRHSEPKNSPNANVWNHWKRKATNYLANEFYEQRDYISALKVYQAMVPLDERASWQWPAIYQIGRCYEQLNFLGKAAKSYKLIIEGKEWKSDLKNLSSTLKSLRETAQFRLNHILWLKNNENKIEKLVSQGESKRA